MKLRINPKVIVAKVEDILPHPNADSLQIVNLNIGTMSNVSVVCGAKNYQIGDYVPLALPGCLGIERKEIRGIVSGGMMCTASELGVGKEKGDILILNSNLPWIAGQKIVELEIEQLKPEKSMNNKKVQEVNKYVSKEVGEIKTIIRKGLLEIGVKVNTEQINIDRPSDTRFGDYTTNIAMVLAKNNNSNPIEMANNVKANITAMRVEVAGPGFLNIYLEPERLFKKLDDPTKVEQTGSGLKMVIDYSAPNIAKPFGIGHLRSTNIGQALYNLFKYVGWECIGDNHLGDWGTQFGKMMTALSRWGEAAVEEMTIADLEKLYVRFHEEAEKNETLVDEAREWFARLEKNDPEARRLWQECVDISMAEFERVYKLLGVKIDFTHGEAFYEEMLPQIVTDLKMAGLTRESRGALIVDLSGLPPAMLLKSDGATTYFTRDMATVKYRMMEWKPDLIVYEVGSEQQLHFQQVFAACRLMGWEPKQGFKHVAHGLIRWKTGKFSTRKGDTIHLSEVIDKAMEEAKRIADESLVTKGLSPNEKEVMIKTVAMGAIKFNDLSSEPTKDVIFDWEQIMSLEGDSGPYVQYTYARCKSVLEKSNMSPVIPKVLNSEEARLLNVINLFEEKVMEAVERYSPSVLAEYLLSLSRRYNEFYGKCRIVGQPEEAGRLKLTEATATILRTGLEILGIETVERM